VTWDDKEAKVETLLRTAMKAATDSAHLADSTAPEPRYSCYWADSGPQGFTLPATIITASPAVNDGWRTDLYQIPVEVAFLTAEIDDPYRAQVKAMYRAARQAIEGASFTDSDVLNLSVVVGPGSPPQTIAGDEDSPGGLHVVTLPLTVELAAPLR
jgi:hypothetical protein